jgi:hypothetical protein
MRIRIHVIILAFIAVLMAACAKGGTATPAASSPTPVASPIDVTTLDYHEPVFAIADLNAFKAGTYVGGDTLDLEGYKLRSLCAETAPEPGADAGFLAEIQDKAQTLSLTTSVQGFSDSTDAQAAFDALKQVAAGCQSYTNEGDSFERIDSAPIKPAGDDAFSLFVKKTDTGLIVSDNFVIRGQFVHDVRFVWDATAPLTMPIAAAIVDETVKKFIAWSDEKLA